MDRRRERGSGGGGWVLTLASGIVIGALVDSSASGLLGAIYTLGADSQHIILFSFMFFGLAVIIGLIFVGCYYVDGRTTLGKERIKAEAALETERIKHDSETLRDHGFIGTETRDTSGKGR